MDDSRQFTRRQFLGTSAAAGAGLYLGSGFPFIRHAFALSTPTLDPATVPKYVTPLVIPPRMPRRGVKLWNGQPVDYYEIAVRQFQQQVLPATYGRTTVWSYGSPFHRGTFNYPGFTIEADWHRPVRVKWMNQLIDSSGNYLPHLLPVDPTLHWANPPGGTSDRDTRPDFTGQPTPGPYTGPVPLVTHVHGAHVGEESDGYPEAWYLPAAKNIPTGYAEVGSWYDTFREQAEEEYGETWTPGSAVFQYPNDQNAATLWYHDHSLGITRTNVYAGPAGFYLVRGGPTDLPSSPGASSVLPHEGPRTSHGKNPVYEIPIAIQDRSFNLDGSFFYPDSREFFDQYAGPYVPETDVPPLWNPEFFGNAIVVNGNTWPVLAVEPRRYRFRLLNGCNSRFLVLKMTTGDPTARPATAALPFWRIGAEGGFLPAPVEQTRVLMAPAERADCIVDFTGIAAGTEIYLVNEGPDEPFGGGEAPTDFDFANPLTTGQVMKFVVGELRAPDLSVPADELELPGVSTLPAEDNVRQVSINEMAHMGGGFDGPVEALLGVMQDGTPVQKMWGDAVTENPALGATEVWELHNFTEDAHPIHLHHVMFRVLEREAFTLDTEGKVVLSGSPAGPEAWETGDKDTVIAYPGQVTRLKAMFDTAGRFVWHCHILEHEDNEMMRPMQIGD